MVIFWQLVIIGTGNWHIDLEMGTLLHVSCAGISRDLRKSSTPSLSGNRSFCCYSCWIDCLLLKFGSYIIFIRPQKFWGRIMVWRSRRRQCTLLPITYFLYYWLPRKTWNRRSTNGYSSGTRCTCYWKLEQK
jgi:hypothetical protein